MVFATVKSLFDELGGYPSVSDAVIKDAPDNFRHTWGSLYLFTIQVLVRWFGMDLDSTHVPRDKWDVNLAFTVYKDVHIVMTRVVGNPPAKTGVPIGSSYLIFRSPVRIIEKQLAGVSWDPVAPRVLAFNCLMCTSHFIGSEPLRSMEPVFDEFVADGLLTRVDDTVLDKHLGASSGGRNLVRTLYMRVGKCWSIRPFIDRPDVYKTLLSV